MNIFHLLRPYPKHAENSIRGIRRAKRLGFDAIDLDMLITEDNVIVGCHWPRPLHEDGFRDPKHKVGKYALVHRLPWSVVARLRAGYFPAYRIQRIERLLEECARVGIRAVVEPKGDPRFREDWPWDFIAKAADRVGCHVSMYVLTHNDGPRVVGVAARHGIPGHTIH